MGDTDLARIIGDSMRECIEENEEALAANCRAAGERAVKLLKQKSRERTGAYKKGWRADVTTDETGTECVVHNRVHQLTHLLEKEHAVRNQTGRSYGSVPGDGVIAEVCDQVAAEFASAGDGT